MYNYIDEHKWPFLSCPPLAWCNIGIRFSIHPSLCPFVHQSINFCVNSNFDPNVQVYFPRTIKATVMMLGISLHLGMTTHTAVSIFDLDLHFTVHQLCKFVWHDIVFGRNHALFNLYIFCLDTTFLKLSYIELCYNEVCVYFLCFSEFFHVILQSVLCFIGLRLLPANIMPMYVILFIY